MIFYASTYDISVRSLYLTYPNMHIWTHTSKFIYTFIHIYEQFTIFFHFLIQGFVESVFRFMIVKNCYFLLFLFINLFGMFLYKKDIWNWKNTHKAFILYKLSFIWIIYICRDVFKHGHKYVKYLLSIDFIISVKRNSDTF
jgi:hypothetical protein